MKPYLVAAVPLALAALLVGCPSSAPATEPTCSGAAALSAAPLVGSSLGAKQLSLTFDDGPASRTSELSTYLKGKGIRATFFINGKNVPAGAVGATLLTQLVADGHLVANHTQNHPSLTNAQLTNAAIVKELTDTDAIIGPYVTNGRFLFRAPYGDWNIATFNALQASPMTKYVGHIDWDYGGARTATTAADWACWQENPKLSSVACGDLYLNEIQTSAQKRGIVLFHDADYGDNTNQQLGNTIDMVKYLVPLLEAQGYTWKRLDEVPAIAQLLPALPPDAGVDAATDSGDGGDGGTGYEGGAPKPTDTPLPPGDDPPSTVPAPAPSDCPDAGASTTASHRAHAH